MKEKITMFLLYYNWPKEMKELSVKFTGNSNGFEPVTTVFWTVKC
jgi:hypothetical protein